MRRAQALLIIAMAISLGGCILRKQPTVKAAPAPPRPIPAPAPAPPPEPLSIPQTNVQLPPPQPVTPEALATTLPADEPAPPTIQPPRVTNRTPRPGTTPPRTEPPAAAPATLPAAESERPPISELTPPGELKRLQDEAESRRQEVAQLIGRISRGRLRQQQNSVDRIKTFLKQAEDAEGRGDMRQASELAGRALVLARELK